MSQANNNNNMSRLFLLLLTLLLSGYSEGHYSVSMPSAIKKCFAVSLPYEKTSKLSGTFEMMEFNVGSQPMRVYVEKVKSPTAVVYESLSERRGSYSITGRGRFNICIENGVTRESDGRSRRVALTIKVKATYEDHKDQPGPMSQSLSKINALADDVVYNIDALVDNMEMLKQRERIHRDVVEKTFQNVWRWTLFEKLVLILVSLSQILYFKSFFRLKGGY